MKSLEAALNSHDVDAVIACLATDIIIRSPITQRIRFSGIDQAADLLRRVFDIISDIRVYETIGDGQRTEVIFWRGRVGRHYLEEANLLRLSDDAHIQEMTIFMRPVPGLLALAVELASSLASRHHRVRALVVRFILSIITMTYWIGEPAVISLVGAGVATPTRER